MLNKIPLLALGIVIVATSAPAMPEVVGWRMDGDGRYPAARPPLTWTADENEQIWEARIQGSRHYASPLLRDGRLYAVSREQRFSILDAKTGQILHERKLDLDSGANSAYPSISLARDKIFLSTENGTRVVLRPGDDYEEIARNSIEGFRSSPVFAGNRMYVRTFDHLYCFGS